MYRVHTHVKSSRPTVLQVLVLAVFCSFVVLEYCTVKTLRYTFSSYRLRFFSLSTFSRAGRAFYADFNGFHLETFPLPVSVAEDWHEKRLSFPLVIHLY